METFSLWLFVTIFSRCMYTIPEFPSHMLPLHPCISKRLTALFLLNPFHSISFHSRLHSVQFSHDICFMDVYNEFMNNDQNANVRFRICLKQWIP